MNIEKILSDNEKLISKSRKHMEEINDFEHDYNHIKDVVKNVIEIMNNIDEIFDSEVCIIAAYWHDVGRTVQNENHENISGDMLKLEMEKLEYDKDFIQKCYDAILFHKWNMTPKTIEGKIVRDADKLAYLGIGRWHSCIENNQRLDDIIELLPNLKNEILFFDYSKKLYDKEIIKVLKLIYQKLYKI